jgi:hypothetical protein
MVTKNKKSSSRSDIKLVKESQTLTKTGQRVSCANCQSFDVEIIGKGCKGFICRCNSCNKKGSMPN